MRAGPSAARAAIHRQALAPAARVGVGVGGLGFAVWGYGFWFGCALLMSDFLGFGVWFLGLGFWFLV